MIPRQYNPHSANPAGPQKVDVNITGHAHVKFIPDDLKTFRLLTTIVVCLNGCRADISIMFIINKSVVITPRHD